MTLASPEWLLAIPALIVMGWRIRGLRLWEPLRFLMMAVLLFALVDPRFRRGGGGLDLWVLADRSDSSAAVTAAMSPELTSILERTKHADDRVFYVDFADDAVRRDRGDPVFRGLTSRTRIGAALEWTLAQMEPNRSARLLVLSDGFATEPMGESADQVLRSGVTVDYRLTGVTTEGDVRIKTIRAPHRVLPGEAFLVEFAIQGDEGSVVPWEVLRDGKVSANGEATVRDGIARVRLTDRLNAGGAVPYVARLRPTADTHTENNTARVWVEVAGGPRALLLTNYPDDPLAALMQAQGLDVVLITDPSRLDQAALSGARLVVLNNVPANRVSTEFLGALDFFVREQGGGLMMAGGVNSFGSGGYFSSAIDPLLPVSMELKNEHRKLATAMAIVLDRSGSMAASAGGGQTKMDLANTGSARAIELLGDYDAVSVHAVDSTAHEIVGLAQVGPNRNAMINAVSRVQSTGGGIFVYEGLKAGWTELQKAETGQRHLILFSDAADSEEPGDYVALLAEMRKQGATVSVIGLGSPTDVDAKLLEDIAAKGGGRMFFNSNAADLPAVFAQETVSVARSTFVKDPTGAEGTPGWAEIAARPPAWLSSVDGYNLSYLRPQATASLVTTDEYQAPLVASWVRGSGRVAAVSFPLGGENSARARGWTGYGDFVQTLTRWLAGENIPPGLALRTATDGEWMSLDLYYDQTWTQRIVRTPPVAKVAATSGAASDEIVGLVWERMEPGHFRASARIDAGARVRGVVRVDSVTLPFGPLTVTDSAEWSYDRDRLRELRQLSERSGGRERLDLASVWDAPRAPNTRGIRGWLLVAFAVLMLIDAALTRLDIWPARWLAYRFRRRATSDRGKSRPARP